MRSTSTGYPHPHPSALKSRGRADGAVETFGGGVNPGLGGLHGRDREECLGVVRGGILGRKLLPWAWMPGLLWATTACLYGKGLCLSPFSGVRPGSLS